MVENVCLELTLKFLSGMYVIYEMVAAFHLLSICIASGVRMKLAETFFFSNRSCIEIRNSFLQITRSA